MYSKKTKLALYSVALMIITVFLTIGVCNPFGFFSYYEFAKFRRVTKILASQYYEPYRHVDSLDGAISGYVEALGDPYTNYMDASVAKMFNEQIRGVFEGVGVVIAYGANDDKILVVDTIEGSPARNAGISQGDRILKVDDREISGDNYDKVVNAIRGPANTAVSLTVEKKDNGEVVDIPLRREKIQLKSVTVKLLEDNIGYIKISSFTCDENSEANSTASEFMEGINSLSEQKMEDLIIDLRGNPGGIFQQALLVSEPFLSEQMIVYTVDKKGKKVAYKSEKKNTFKRKVVILIDGGSASASEIVAGALRDNEKAVLIGEKTFGKGLVQNTFSMSDKSELKVTVSRYYTPQGVCIDKQGISPDIEIVNDKNSNQDLQLNRAIEYITTTLRNE